jgi:REP element-mobilizing transposase RayT
VDRKPTFLDKEDYRSFLNLLTKSCDMYGVRIIAVTLMPNHFHILSKSVLGKNVSLGMKWLTGVYAQSFNKKHERTGHLWQDRFYSKEVREGRHLGTVWRYVEQNPVRACLVDNPNQWEWSSAHMRNSKHRLPCLIEPEWWGTKLMKQWWSTELLEPEMLDAVRRSLQRSELGDAGIDWD